MLILGAIVAIAMILGTLVDVFETIVLPRRVTQRFRLTNIFFRVTWPIWRFLARKISSRRRRENFLSLYGPLALISLLGTWTVILIVGFALIQWSLGSALVAPEKHVSFGTDLYMSGSTFFTLGYGDVVPSTGITRFFAVFEAGIGFGMLALVIGYLPVLYQAFSRREANISLLDARAGSPPSAVELLRRYAEVKGMENLAPFLAEWERWAAELLESHLSYPVLAYFRSQHESESWIAAIVTILDASALIIIGADGGPIQQARHTFAMARHAAVDLSQIFVTKPRNPNCEYRLTSPDMEKMRTILVAVGVTLPDGPETEQKLLKLRRYYEPFVITLADYLLIDVPKWLHEEGSKDNWQTSSWELTATGMPVQAEKVKDYLPPSLRI
jgi:hypothetical protein